MAVKIKVVCSDRLGRQMSTRIVEGQTYQGCKDEKNKAINELKKQFPEPGGLDPFIFVEVSYH